MTAPREPEEVGPDDVLAAALASGATWKSAAATAGVSESTVARRARDPGFKERVSDLRGQMVSEAVGFLSRAMSAASVVLVGLLKSESEGTKLKAARGILELATRLRESEELAARVEALEARLAGKQP